MKAKMQTAMPGHDRRSQAKHMSDIPVPCWQMAFASFLVLSRMPPSAVRLPASRNKLFAVQAQHDADQDATLAKRRRDAQERERVTRLTLDRQVRLYLDPRSKSCFRP